MALATRQAEVVEMYQPMTDAMRQCQDAITECMEAMLVELKRDHSLVSLAFLRYCNGVAEME
jgi:DNA excision repair protein ERCC-4